MVVKAFGSQSGLNAEVICRASSICKLICKNNACDGLTYRCLSGSACRILPSACEQDNSVASVDGINCPTFSNELSTNKDRNKEYENDETRDEQEKLELHIKEKQKRYELLMNKHISVGSDNTCDADVANGCEGETLSASAECNALQSCVDAVINGDSVRCYGEGSCAGALFNEPGYIFCAGYQGCKDVTYDPSTTGDFICVGKESCMNIKPTHTMGEKEVSCFADSSCKGMEVVSGSSDQLDCYGNRACYSSNITTAATIQCEGIYVLFILYL